MIPSTSRGFEFLTSPARERRTRTFGRLVHLPAVSVWSNFDDCHDKAFAFDSQRAYLFM
jgi:hypothetical protein